MKTSDFFLLLACSAAQAAPSSSSLKDAVVGNGKHALLSKASGAAGQLPTRIDETEKLLKRDPYFPGGFLSSAAKGAGMVGSSMAKGFMDSFTSSSTSAQPLAGNRNAAPRNSQADLAKQVSDQLLEALRSGGNTGALPPRAGSNNFPNNQYGNNQFGGNSNNYGGLNQFDGNNNGRNNNNNNGGNNNGRNYDKSGNNDNGRNYDNTRNPAPQQPSSPSYAQCAGNSASGACPNELVCVGDPRSRGLTMDAICVPTRTSCGGQLNTMCENGLICVADPRSNCRPWAGDYGCAGVCV